MRRISLMLLPLFFTALLITCSSHQPGEPAKEGERPRLTLSAVPKQGLAPMTVFFNATLTGVKPDDKDYYCLEESWDFGDGAVSEEQPNCESFGPDSQIRTQFLTEHEYSEEGTYTIRFNLGKGKVRANSVSVIVLTTDPEKRLR